MKHRKNAAIKRTKEFDHICLEEDVKPGESNDGATAKKRIMWMEGTRLLERFHSIRIPTSTISNARVLTVKVAVSSVS